MDSALILLLINTIANMQNLEINKDKQTLDNIDKKMDKIIELLEEVTKNK